MKDHLKYKKVPFGIDVRDGGCTITAGDGELSIKGKMTGADVLENARWMLVRYIDVIPEHAEFLRDSILGIEAVIYGE